MPTISETDLSMIFSGFLRNVNIFIIYSVKKLNKLKYFETDLDAARLLDPLIDQFDNLAIFLIRKLKVASSKSNLNEIPIGISNTLELVKIITHYDLLSNAKSKPDLTLRTWTHLLDLVFDLDSLTRPLNELDRISENNLNMKSFSEITEESQESEASSERLISKEISRKIFDDNEELKENKGIEEFSEEAGNEEIHEKSKSNESHEKKESYDENKVESLEEKKIESIEVKTDREENTDLEEKAELEEKERKNMEITSSSPSTKTYLQSKLKRREVIQGKVINEFSINSLDRQSLASLSEFDKEEGREASENFSPANNNTVENRIKKQEMLIKTKSNIFDENMRNLETKSAQTDIFSCLLGVLFSNFKDSLGKVELKSLMEKKEEFLFFNEEIFETGEENDDEEQQMMVMLTRKKKGVFLKIFEKLKAYLSKNPSASIFLNGYSMNVVRCLSYAVKVLEVLQVSTLNLHLISQEFNVETIEFLIQFSTEVLNYHYIKFSSFDLETIRSKMIEVVDIILSTSRRIVCYVPLELKREDVQENMGILRSLVYFFNINLLFSRKELKTLLSKYKNNSNLEPYSFEQQMYIISNKMANSLRFAIFSSKEDFPLMSSQFKTFQKVFLKPGNPIFEDLHVEFSLALELPIDKTNKISFVQYLEAEFAQSFKDFHGFSLRRNADFDKLLIKYIDGEMENFIERRLREWKQKEIPGKIIENFIKKEEQFKMELKELEEKLAMTTSTLESTIHEAAELKEKSAALTKEAESLKQHLDSSEKKLSEMDQSLVDLYANSKAKRIEILQRIRGISEFDHEFLDGGFEKSDPFKSLAMAFYLIFKKASGEIGSPLKRELSIIKSQSMSPTFEENRDDSPGLPGGSVSQLSQKLTLKCLGNQQKLLEIFYSYDYQDMFPRSQLETIENAVEFPQEISLNGTQTAVYELLRNELSCGMTEKELFLEKNKIVSDFRQIKAKFDEHEKQLEMISVKLSRTPGTISDYQLKKLSCEQILSKSTKNLTLIEGLMSNLREILNVALEMDFPYFSNESILVEIRFCLTLFIVFLLKYPSFYRRILLQKMETLLIINKDFHLLDYPLFSTLRDCTVEEIENQPLAFNFLNTVSVVEILSEFRELPLVIVDANGMYLEFLKGKKNHNHSISIEEICEDSKTNTNILESVEKGRLLIIKDCNKSLFAKIQPLLTWMFDEMLNKVLKATLTSKTENSSSEPDHLVEVLGRTLTVHRNFRLLLIFQNEEFLKSSFPELISKSLILFTDIEDKKLWEQTFTLRLSQRMESVERKTMMDQLFVKTSNHYKANEIIYMEFLQEFRKISSIQEISNGEKLRSNFAAIRGRFFEDFSKILRKNPDNMKKSSINKEYLDVYKEIKKFVQHNILKKQANAFEIKDKSKFQGIVEFMHVVKLANFGMSQVIGNIYSFSDFLYLETLDHTITILRDNFIEFPVFLFY